MKKVIKNGKDFQGIDEGDAREYNNRKKFIKVLLWLLVIAIGFMFLSIVIALICSLFLGVPDETKAVNDELIISIISIAVTVWIGLNIYNVISKEDIDIFMNKIDKKINKSMLQLREIDDKLQETDTKLSKIQFIFLLNKTRSRYIISYYFAICFSNSNEKMSNINILVKIEYLFTKTIQFYENNEYDLALQYCQKAIDELSRDKNINKEIINKKEEDYELLDAYTGCRLSDLYFYKNISSSRINVPVSINELTDSIKLYRSLEKYIDEHLADYQANYISNELHGYIHNSIAYTYQEMAFLSDEKEDKKRYKEAAEKEYKEVFLNYRENGRYYRNYGTFLERTNKKEEALKKYKKAMELNKFDYKAYNNYYALKLKIIESKILEIMSKNNIKLYNGLKSILPQGGNFDIIGDINDAIKDIDDAILKLKVISRNEFNFCDLYYNTGKGYLLKYLLDKNSDKKLLDEALEINDFALLLNKKNLGALFTKRNIYEAYGKIEKANEINDQIKEINAINNDTCKKSELYQNYLSQQGDISLSNEKSC